MDNGSEYTLNLPFVVQCAWPVEPHGLFIQRVVEAWELEELKESSDTGITTVFSLTSPFAEPAALGVVDSIKGGFGSVPLQLKQDYATDHTVVPPADRVLWVSQQAWGLTDKLMVTLNSNLNRITIWRYVYAPPSPSSAKSNRPSSHTHHAKRSSMSGNTSAQLRQTNAASEDLLQSPGKPDARRSSAIPGLPPTLTTTTTMEDLMNGAVPGTGVARTYWNLPFRFKLDPSGKFSLSETDPATEPVDLDDIPDPAEEMRMRSQFWVESLYEETIPEAAYVTRMLSNFWY